MIMLSHFSRYSLTPEDFSKSTYWEHNFDVYNVYCEGKLTKLQVTHLTSVSTFLMQIIVSALGHKEGDGKAFAAAVITRFDLDIVRHAIFDTGYISRLNLVKLKI